MIRILPQQQLLLELLVMSGDIAVAENIAGTILERTLQECEAAGWVTSKRFGAGFNKVSVAPAGRKVIGR